MLKYVGKKLCKKLPCTTSIFLTGPTSNVWHWLCLFLHKQKVTNLYDLLFQNETLNSLPQTKILFFYVFSYMVQSSSGSVKKLLLGDPLKPDVSDIAYWGLAVGRSRTGDLTAGGRDSTVSSRGEGRQPVWGAGSWVNPRRTSWPCFRQREGSKIGLECEVLWGARLSGESGRPQSFVEPQRPIWPWFSQRKPGLT